MLFGLSVKPKVARGVSPHVISAVRLLLEHLRNKTMDYVAVDKVLTPWLKRYGLHVFTMCRDDEVRSIDVVDDVGDRYQIFISKPDGKGRVGVSVWNYKKQTKSFESQVSGLEEMLEDAYSQVIEWINHAGHTRTPVL
ncbi:MAG: hypothetical protein M3033_19675 [Acidobacteriota bacterium]|nr:hypothetical protein [Acidobacteriota bacterium]